MSDLVGRGYCIGCLLPELIEMTSQTAESSFYIIDDAQETKFGAKITIGCPLMLYPNMFAVV
jgi:hypothetical protein